MPIQIIAPTPYVDKEGYEDEEGGVSLAFDDDGDVAMDGGSSQNRHGRGAGGIVTPGEIVTDDPQWMR